MSRRGLDSLPDAIGTLRHLRKLNAAQNPRLCALPASIEHLTELRTLFFLGCGFERIPRALGRLPHLFMLSFKSNRLAAIDEDALAPSLAWLILTDNRLCTLPASLGRRRGCAS